jgi:hypothetical protein
VRHEENFEQQQTVETRENEANTGNWRTYARHEENLPRITQTWDRREESPPGSVHESSLGSARVSGACGPHLDPADTDVSESSGGMWRTPSRGTASARGAATSNDSETDPWRAVGHGSAPALDFSVRR